MPSERRLRVFRTGITIHLETPAATYLLDAREAWRLSSDLKDACVEAEGRCPRSGEPLDPFEP